MMIMILGASGMLGQALVAEAMERGHAVIADRVELTDRQALLTHLDAHQPDIIINAAALVDLKACEDNPGRAYEINTQPVLFISEYLATRQAKLVQISTDQAIAPVNVYGQTKQEADHFAGPDALVIRTNIVGPKNMAWAFEAIERDTPVTLFDDYVTNSIDIWCFSRILFDVLERRPRVSGIVNIAGRDAVNKKQFVEALAARMGKPLTHAVTGSIKDIADGITRPENSVLHVNFIERLFHRPMPGLGEVINNLEKHYARDLARKTH